MGGIDEDDKGMVEYLRKETEEQERKLQMIKEKYTIK